MHCLCPICSFVRLSVCLSVCRQNTYTKTQFSQKLRSWELWSLLKTFICRPTWTFQTTHWTPEIQENGDPPSWKSWNRHISTKNHAISMKFGTQQHNWNSMRARWPNMNIFKNSRWRTTAISKLVFWP